MIQYYEQWGPSKALFFLLAWFISANIVGVQDFKIGRNDLYMELGFQ